MHAGLTSTMVSFVNFSHILKIGARFCTRNLVAESLAPGPCQAKQVWNAQSRFYRKMRGIPRCVPWLHEYPKYQSEVRDPTEEEEQLATDVSKEINAKIAENRVGRLFAVIHLAGKQFKVTETDLVVIQGYWPPSPGDQLKLEKVLLVGGSDFTLVGRPILNRELVSIDATVIDKTFSHTVTHFRFRKRKQYRRIHFYRHQQTMVRINSITLNGRVDKKLEVEGLDRVY